ncbi:MAG: hypothetical protein LBV30_05040 [Propionibacteriaceae bacterium]|nr:hypothetical protein [Propionibacteriaceae bacterium]
MITLHVNATRTKRDWTLTGVEFGAVSEVTRLDQAAEDMREPLAWLSGLPEDGFDVVMVPQLPTAYQTEQEQAHRFRADADKANAQSAEHARRSAKVLADTGMPLRDVGTVMGISYQRAHQLVKAAA